MNPSAPDMKTFGVIRVWHCRTASHEALPRHEPLARDRSPARAPADGAPVPPARRLPCRRARARPRPGSALRRLLAGRGRVRQALGHARAPAALAAPRRVLAPGAAERRSDGAVEGTRGWGA